MWEFITGAVLSLSSIARRPWWYQWENVSIEIRLLFTLAAFVVSLLVMTGVLYLAGIIVVGRKRALLGDAFLISVLGTVLEILCFLFIPYGLIATILAILIWLLLIKRLYETGWLGATAVGILAVIIFIAMVIVLAFIFWALFAISIKISELFSFTLASFF